MGIKTYRPYTETRRFQTSLTFEEITTSEPHKPLLEPKTRISGRNNHGEITIWRRGRTVGYRPDWKKAYVKLRAGEKVPEYVESA